MPVVKRSVGKVPEFKAVIFVVETFVEEALVTVMLVPVAFVKVSPCKVDTPPTTWSVDEG